jgi:hypothetical protein
MIICDSDRNFDSVETGPGNKNTVLFSLRPAYEYSFVKILREVEPWAEVSEALESHLWLVGFELCNSQHALAQLNYLI